MIDEIETYLSISSNKFTIYLFDKKNLVNLYKEQRKIQLKLKKCDEYMIQFKTKLLRKDYPICDELYSDLHKLDEKIQEISKLVDNNKD